MADPIIIVEEAPIEVVQIFVEEVAGPQGIQGPRGESFTFAMFTPEQLVLIRGNAFTYADFTPTQIEALKIKGDTGAAFTYAMFTPEQLNGLKVKGDPFLYADFTIGQLAALTGQKGDQGIQGQDGVVNKRILSAKINFDTAILTIGNGKMKFPNWPAELNGWILTNAQAGVTTVSSSGRPTLRIYNYTTSQNMLSTAITIDATEGSSYTADTPSVINALYRAIATGDVIGVDCDVAGTGAMGLSVTLTFEKP